MSAIIIEQNKDSHPAGVPLVSLGGDVTAPTFEGIGDSNLRLVDAKALVSACAGHIESKVKLSVAPGVFFIYRGVAVGGLARGLGGFSSKPLSVKSKSLDPSIIASDKDLTSLSGLVPMQKKLGKKGDPNDTNLIELAKGQQSYRVVNVDDSVGKVKTYLCCGNTDRTLSWEKTMTPSGKTLCTFLGDTTNPYLADWDLVLVGVTKNSILKDNTLSNYLVVDKPDASGMHNILPQWLFDCLSEQKVPLSSHVTQHGPESLYCGNDIKQPGEEFIVLTSAGAKLVINKNSNTISGETPWDKVVTYVSKELNGYFCYQFAEFDGTGITKPSDYGTSITKLNSTLTPK